MTEQAGIPMKDLDRSNMRDKPPALLDGAHVICYTRLDARHQPTGNTRHYLDGQLQTGFRGLAIAQYAQDHGFYLFYCSAEWEVQNDTYHASLQEAKEQAEFEFQGTLETWIDCS